ncbi:hypothetical protein O6H91_Y499400 [Diphasiastrum complanatum]|nr:hypothetical protein O6H91_Y499400 [Diphasiastrum complanatum]
MASDATAARLSEIKVNPPNAAVSPLPEQVELTMHGSLDDSPALRNSLSSETSPRIDTRSLFASRFRKCMPKSSFQIAAEMIGTFILVFTGCGSAMVDTKSQGSITHFGVSTAFGLVVMIIIYSIGHISGAHINPAVTLAFATVRHFPWAQVPAYIGAQVVSAITAAFVLRALFNPVANIGATIPAGSNAQSFVLEMLITYILMFVVSAVATDTRAIGELAGLAVGSTVALNAIFAGPISGASMNPARSLGPAIAANNYKGIWVYIIGPTLGALLGAWSYNMIRLPEEENKKDEPRSRSFKR